MRKAIQITYQNLSKLVVGSRIINWRFPRDRRLKITAEELQTKKILSRAMTVRLRRPLKSEIWEASANNKEFTGTEGRSCSMQLHVAPSADFEKWPENSDHIETGNQWTENTTRYSQQVERLQESTKIIGTLKTIHPKKSPGNVTLLTWASCIILNWPKIFKTKRREKLWLLKSMFWGCKIGWIG